MYNISNLYVLFTQTEHRLKEIEKNQEKLQQDITKILELLQECGDTLNGTIYEVYINFVKKSIVELLVVVALTFIPP